MGVGDFSAEGRTWASLASLSEGGRQFGHLGFVGEVQIQLNQSPGFQVDQAGSMGTEAAAQTAGLFFPVIEKYGGENENDA